MKLVRTYHRTAADLLAQRTFDTTDLLLWNGDDTEYALSRVY
jgi:hypothetical protein